MERASMESSRQPSGKLYVKYREKQVSDFAVAPRPAGPAAHNGTCVPRRFAAHFADNLERWLAGEALVNVVAT